MGEKNSVVSEVKLESKSFFPLALCLLMREGAVPPCVCSESPMTKAVSRERFTWGDVSFHFNWYQ